MPLYYTVWNTAAEVANGPVLNEGSITITGTSTQSSAAMDTSGGNRGRRVRVFATEKCFVTWGANPTASASDGRPIGEENHEYFDIPADELLAVISRA